MQELATFIEIYFDGKTPMAGDLAELVKSSDKFRDKLCEAVMNAIDDYNHIKKFFKQKNKINRPWA